MIKVIVRDRFYIPISAVNKDALVEHCQIKYADKTQCRPNCKFARFASRFCSTCPAADNFIKMWEKIVTKKGRTLIAIPCGDSKLLDKVVNGKYTLIDKRFTTAMRYNLEWTGKLRRGELNSRGDKTANQKQMLSAWRKHVESGETGGTVCAPARTGKCLIAGTMIRTDKGYQLIEDLFDGVETDQVGIFGNIAVPHGVEQIRGLHKREADHLIRLSLANGIKLTVTPEHAFVVAKGNDRQFWVQAQKIEKNTHLVIHDTKDPVAKDVGFSALEAKLLGHILACADLSCLLQTNVVYLDGVETDYPEYEDFSLALWDVLNIELSDDTRFEMVHTCFKNWQAKMLASNDEAWQYFIRTLFSANYSKTPSVSLPTLLARALHFHLVTHGVEATLIDTMGKTVIVHKSNELQLYLKNKINHNLKVRVEKVEQIFSRHTVYDLMILPDHAFITDGVTSHNTVIGVAAVMSQRQRAFITASQRRFLLQFAQRFGELTNVKEFYDRGRYPVVFVDPKKWPDAHKYGIKVVSKWDASINKADVIIAAYQQFISEKGQRRLKKYISGKVGTIVGDEIHMASAPCFNKVINRSNIRYRLGLTATTIRKDCVAPKTLVQTREGKKPIDSIKIGDEVMSYSFESKKVEYKKVLKIHNRKNSSMLKISTEAGDIICTPDHEFWCEAKQAYVKAKNLTIDNSFLFSP